jgi:triphosphatase
VGLTEASPDADPAAEQAHASASGAVPPRPVLGPPPGPIAPTDRFAVAGRKAMWPHVRRMLEREDALRDPAQTDALKRYRVATRRLRAALRVFRDAYPRRTTKRLRRGLAGLADALGAVRDLDVRLEELDAWARGRGDVAVAGVAPLRAAVEGDRRAAASTLLRKVESRSHRTLLSNLVAFVESDQATSSPDGTPDRLTRDRVASAIWARYEAVRAFAPVIDEADLPTLHRLRIEAKRLRYTIEFLADVLGREQAWLVERLVALQDHLGALNDATLAVAAARGFLSERGEKLARAEWVAIEDYLSDRDRERERLRGSVAVAWRPVASGAFLHRLARAVVID